MQGPANELQRAGETNSSWWGSLLKTLLDIIKADNDRQPLAGRHDSKVCYLRVCVCVSALGFSFYIILGGLKTENPLYLWGPKLWTLQVQMSVWGSRYGDRKGVGIQLCWENC